MGVRRLYTGLLFYDDFSAGSIGPAWSTSGGWSIVGGRLKSPAGVSSWAQLNANAFTSQPNGLYAQTLAMRPTDNEGAAILCRTTAVGHHYNYAPLKQWWAPFGEQHRLHLWNGGDVTIHDVYSANSKNVFHRICLYAYDNAQSAYYNGSNICNGAHAGLNGQAGRAGVQTQDSGAGTGCEFDNFAAMTSGLVTCSNMPAGWKLRISGTVGVEAGGTATVTLWGAAFPFATVEILDGADVLQDSYSPLDGVWGGDGYEYYPPVSGGSGGVAMRLGIGLGL